MGQIETGVGREEDTISLLDPMPAVVGRRRFIYFSPPPDDAAMRILDGTDPESLGRIHTV